jgi:autotransporter-associated beta strand protein
MIGANNYTIQNGQIAAPGTEAIIHQMGSGILTLNGTIGNTTTTLTKNGNGTLVLNGASTNTGAVVINRGTIKAGISTVPAVSGALGNGNNPLTVNAVGILDLNGNNVGVGQFNAGNGVITNSGSLASLTVGNNNASKNTANTLFTGPLQLIVNGNGAWTAIGTSANSHTGGTVFTNNGVINHRVNVASFFGTGTIFFKNGGNFQNTAALVVTNPVNITGVGNIWNWQLSSTVNPCVTMQGPWTGNGTLHFDQGFNNPIFLFNGNNMSGFTGTAQLQAGGTVGAVYSINTTNPVFDASQSIWDIGSISGASAVTVLQSISTNSGTVIRLGALTTAGSLGSGVPILRNNAGNTTNIFEVGALNANNTFAGVISDGQNAGAVLGLTKVGTGIWTLTASETYSGPTTISNGILVVNGSLGGAPVNVYAPGALGGSGSISSAVTLDSGNAGIRLTNNAGATLSLNGGLTLNNGNVLAFDLGTVSDQIAVSGGFSMNGTITVNLAAIGGFGLGTYTLISGAGIASTNGFVLGSIPSGYAATLTSDGSSLQVQFPLVFLPRHFGTIMSARFGAVILATSTTGTRINLQASMRRMHPEIRRM